MANIFNSVLYPKVDTNRFTLDHDVKLSFKMGQLVPTCVMDVMPGDKFEISVENMLRFAPLVSPVMHNVKVTTHFWFIPNRILWSEWEQFITGATPDDIPSHPYINVEECTVGSLCDYLGFPAVDMGAGPARKCNPLSIAAYLKVYNEWYRDQNLQSPIQDTCTEGDNSFNFGSWLTDGPLNRAWMHDYFTSALPFAQKGDAVQIPLTQNQTVPVDWNNATNADLVRDPATGVVKALDNAFTTSVGGGLLTDGTAASIDNTEHLSVDVQSEATDINTLRRAFRLQEWLEKNARGGTRYVESLLAHFGVKSDDARLQRPEYIGGAKQNMVISEVLATAQSSNDGSNAEINVGQMAGHGISVGGGNRFRYRAKEHGWIIGIINVQPVTAYQQGIPRMHARQDRLDYPWPTFANIGEQEVLQQEIYAPSATPLATFGYVPRYAEMKYMPSRVCGDMRTSLAFWHMGRIFTSEPQLNAEFIEADPTTRIFAVTAENQDHIYGHIFNNVKVVRKLPKYGVPTI